MDHKRTHIYAFYIGFGAVAILIITLLTVLITQGRQASKEIETDTAKPTQANNTSTEPERTDTFFVQKADIGCTKVAVPANGTPVNTCNGKLSIVSTIKEGDPAVYELNVTDKTQLIEKGAKKDLTFLYQYEKDQTPFVFTTDGNNTALTIEKQ